jgi:hypothetical protein
MGPAPEDSPPILDWGESVLKQAQDAWGDWFGRNGQARIEPVNTKGATYYVAKYINKSGGELVFSENAGHYGRTTNGGRYAGNRPDTWDQGHG